MDDVKWMPIETAPRNEWIRTKREGEKGENVCFMRKYPEHMGGDIEWVAQDGRTTITHGTFAEPTHWLPLKGKSE